MVTLSEAKRKEFVHDCTLMQEDLKLPRGAHKELQEKYNISERTCRGLWTKVKTGLEAQDLNIDLGISKKGKVGRKKMDRAEIIKTLGMIEFNDRRTLRSLQSALDKKGHTLSLGTLLHLAKEGLF